MMGEEEKKRIVCCLKEGFIQRGKSLSIDRHRKCEYLLTKNIELTA